MQVGRGVRGWRGGRKIGRRTAVCSKLSYPLLAPLRIFPEVLSCPYFLPLFVGVFKRQIRHRSIRVLCFVRNDVAPFVLVVVALSVFTFVFGTGPGWPSVLGTGFKGCGPTNVEPGFLFWWHDCLFSLLVRKHLYHVDTYDFFVRASGLVTVRVNW